ncbi:MAG TPA: hypothetical protein VKA83_01830 [Methylomirabilota bacterium]|nr:hypothetical protein [Methylomirabilota bacterium]
MKVWRESPGGATIENRVYPVTPPSMTVKSGMITGEVSDLKVTERVEKGGDRVLVLSPARLTGTLRLQNTSANRTIRLVEGRVRFIDAQGQAIGSGAAGTDPIVKLTRPGHDSLDPEQDALYALDVEFPVEALQANRLKDIRLELVYVPSPFREETVNFTVSIGPGE